jgi:hypothetical protein
MKRLAYTTLTLAIAALLSSTALGAPLMHLPEKEFDFGYVPQNSKVSHVFMIYNNGDDSLKIEKVVPG